LASASARTQSGTRGSRPVAFTLAGDTSVFIRQALIGIGLLIEICTKTAAEHDALTVTLDGHTLHPVHPAGIPA
jgi:hypothetical protein